MKNKTVICFSGGLDSTVLLYQLIEEGDEIHCLNFDYGSKHNKTERQKAQTICDSLSIPFFTVDLPFISKLFKSDLLQTCTSGNSQEAKLVVPGRNTILLSIALGYAESISANRVAIANHADDHEVFPDTRPEWVASMTLLALHCGDRPIKLYAPFTMQSKADICKIGLQLEVPFEKTWSCYSSERSPCETCDACLLRAAAFQKNGISDPALSC